jgi:hypothetical protein
MKRLLGGAAVGLAGFCLAASAHATVVDFSDLVIPTPFYQLPNNLYSGGPQGLHFMDQEFTEVPAGFTGLPNGSVGQFIELGNSYDAIDPNLHFSATDGSAFNLQSMKLGLGDDNDQVDGGYDLVTVTGVKSANCTYSCGPVSMTLQVTNDWQTFDFSGFTGLASVTVYQQIYTVDGVPTLDPGSIANNQYITYLDQTYGYDIPIPPITNIDNGWLALDSVSFEQDPTGGVGVPGGPVPEPAAWTLMIAGFGLAGSALRRRRAVALAC